MRDIGVLVWVTLLIVGVVGSMISRIRAARRGPQRAVFTPGPVRRPQPVQAASPARPAPSRQPTSVPPRPAASAPPSPGPDSAHSFEHGPVKAPKRLFGGRRDFVRAVIAAEVLGKPRAFGDEYPRA